MTPAAAIDAVFNSWTASRFTALADPPPTTGRFGVASAELKAWRKLHGFRP